MNNDPMIASKTDLNVSEFISFWFSLLCVMWFGDVGILFYKVRSLFVMAYGHWHAIYDTNGESPLHVRT